MRRIHNPQYIFRTTAEWAACTATERKLSAHQIGVNTSTGEMRYGPGDWYLAATRGTAVDLHVAAASTANVTIATGLNAGDVVDGVTLVLGTKVLLKNQTDATENGIYTVAVSPARSTGYTLYASMVGIVIQVDAGTANSGKTFRNSGATSGTSGSTAIAFSEVKTGAFSFDQLNQLTGNLPTKTPVLADKILIQDSVSGLLMYCSLTQAQTLINV